MRWLRRYLLCSVLPLNAHAGEMWGLEDEEVIYASPSSLMIEVGKDDSDVIDLYSVLDLTLFNEHRSTLYIGQSKTTDAAENPYRTYGLSFTSDPSAIASVTLGGEMRKQTMAIKITTRYAAVMLRPGNWLLGIKGERRILNAFTRNNRRVELSGEGAVLTLGYDGFEQWSLMASYRRNSYDKDLNTLVLKRRFLLSPHSLNAAWSLSEQRKSLSITRYFDNIYLIFSWSRDISAIDESIYDYRSLRLAWDITYAWGLEVEAGNGKPEDGEDNAYLSTALNYRW